MGVLPAASNSAIPNVFRSLMEDEDSDIIDFYPTDFPIDLNGKKFAWQGVALLPFIDEKRLLDAMATRYTLLSAEDVARNEMGKDALIFSERHPLYEEVATNFYSKKQGSPKYKLSPSISEGLVGKVEKNEGYIPGMSLEFPLEEGGMPSLEEDHSIRYINSRQIPSNSANFLISVYYEMPRSIHIHKSMLLRGVNFSPAILDKADKEATKNQASRTGRSFGGAPFRGNGRGNGRGGGRGGGQINYANDRNDRPNPFAAHIDPNFAPPPVAYGRGGPPPASHYGPPPRLNGHQNGQPPPPRGSHYGGPPAIPAYGAGYPQPPPGGYYNGPAPPHGGYGNQYGNGRNGNYGGYGYGGR